MMTKSLQNRLGRTLDSLAKREIITPHFERALLRADWPEEYPVKVFNKERRWDGYFHPSTHLNMDPLQLYYEFHPDFHVRRERPSPQLEMTFQIGSAIHAIVQSMFVHLGFTDEDEVEVSFRDEEHHVSGTIDIYRFWLPDGDWVPVEIKSAGYMPKKPHDDHVAQLNVYMDRGYDDPPERGVVFYVEKNTPHRISEFVVDRDQQLLDRIYAKFDDVWDAVRESDPSRFRDCCMADSKKHRGCPARNVCRLGPPSTSAN